MKKVLVSLVLATTGCLGPGDVLKFSSNKSRTSGVLRRAQLQLIAESKQGQVMQFRAASQVKPILGAEQDDEILKPVGLEFLQAPFMARLKSEHVVTQPDFRATYIRPTADGCDSIQLDQLPDGTKVKDLLVVAKVCLARGTVPTLDMTFTSGNRRLTIGFDQIN